MKTGPVHLGDLANQVGSKRTITQPVYELHVGELLGQIDDYVDCGLGAPKQALDLVAPNHHQSAYKGLTEPLVQHVELGVYPHLELSATRDAPGADDVADQGDISRLGHVAIFTEFFHDSAF